MRLIDADALAVDIKECIEAKYDNCEYEQVQGLETALERIDEQLTAEPEQKTGKWIYSEDEYGIDGYYCDKCGFFVPWDYAHKLINYIEDYHYCPNCGHPMGGDGDE